VYLIDKSVTGGGDLLLLESQFHNLLVNFTGG
jgi:hypothetical protein